MITVEELKACKNATEDIIEVVKARIDELFSKYCEHNHLEDDFGFCHNEVKYDVVGTDESPWDDQGKYQYQDITYQLVSYDPKIALYPTKESIIDKFDLFLTMSVTRSGSYFTDYNYEYDKPSLQIAVLKTVPEQIIPEHFEIEMKFMEGKL